MWKKLKRKKPSTYIENARFIVEGLEDALEEMEIHLRPREKGMLVEMMCEKLGGPWDRKGLSHGDLIGAAECMVCCFMMKFNEEVEMATV